MTSIINTAADNIVKDYAENIQFTKTNESYWKGTALGTRIDLGNIKLTKENEQYEEENPVEFHNKLKRYNGFNDSEPIEETFEEYWLVLTYNETSKQWIIDEVKDYYSYNDEFMKGKDVVKSDFK
ncbi:hypothetical protein QUF94_20660 [Peribacillus sp. NJ4]|uniref:hypothetical protein n=1 Tax=Peribacillus sp. NJ4 TaxID=3055862 RepID=UPI0025A0EFB3|nr:hypothetical protein [Peribacillus sp. NJ4]MDM5213814.1 hypothetical protein [Peribacillus sp. NJ4]